MKTHSNHLPAHGPRPSRRSFLQAFGGGSLAIALAGAVLAGCADMSAPPKTKRSRTYITGRGGGPSNPGR